MKNKNWFGLATLVLSAVLLVSLLTFALPCPLPTEEGMKPMKCYWTYRAVTGISVIMILTGIMQVVSKSVDFVKGISVSNVLFSGLGISLITFIIGTCMKEEMRCNHAFKPTALLILGIILLVNVIGIFKKPAEIETV